MAQKLYLIAAAAERAGVCVGTVRMYCLRGQLQPTLDSSGRRLFVDADIDRIRAIYRENLSRRGSRGLGSEGVERC